MHRYEPFIQSQKTHKISLAVWTRNTNKSSTLPSVVKRNDCITSKAIRYCKGRLRNLSRTMHFTDSHAV